MPRATKPSGEQGHLFDPTSWQSLVAACTQIARDLGLDPIEFRLRNLPDDKPQVAFRRTLQAVADQVDWANRTVGEDEGWGVAIGEWTNGAGPAAAVVSLATDGTAQLFYGLMDLTGTDTACAQIAAEVLGVPMNRNGCFAAIRLRAVRHRLRR